MLPGIFPPSGERWLRESGGSDGSHPLPSGGCCQEYFHRLANGGYGRTVATGERWLREYGGYGRVVATGEWWLRASGGYGRAIRLCILN